MRVGRRAGAGRRAARGLTNKKPSVCRISLACISVCHVDFQENAMYDVPGGSGGPGRGLRCLNV